MLYSINDAQNVLGCLINNPLILLDDKYNLNKYDFRPNMLHLITFVAINNLINQGAKEISFFEIDQYIQQYKSQYEVFTDSNGIEFCKTIAVLNSSDNIDVFYNNVKKFSVLRKYKESGFDISKWFDESKSESDELEKLASVSVEDIINYYEKLQSDIKRQFCINSEIEETKMGEGFEEVKESFKQEPIYGRSFLSNALNTVTRGAIKGQYAIFSSPTGVGKTTISYATLCNICATELWNYETQSYELNKNCSNEGGMILQYELDNTIEITPKLLAYISGVNAATITKGNYKNNEEERVDRAIQILKESNIYSICIPNFTMKEIDALINDYVKNKNVGWVVFDYISAGGSINQEIAKYNGTATNEQQVLTTISKFLKDEARKYNIFIYTMTQCNENVAIKEILQESCIMGGRGVAFKGDICGIILPPRQKELKAYEMVREKRGFNHLECTHVISLYKSRFNDEQGNLRLFINVDMGTGRLTDLCVFDKDLKPYNLKKTILENNT